MAIDILRAKLMDLPERYSFPQHCLEQDDIDTKRLGRTPRTCQEIADYITHFESTVRRKRRSSNKQSRGGYKKAPQRRGRAYWVKDKQRGAPKRSVGPKKGFKPGENPHRSLRGRNARLTIQRARGGKPDGRKRACWSCGSEGHLMRDCPNVKGGHMAPRLGRSGKAYKATFPYKKRYGLETSP